MWILAIYDCPVTTADERKAYQRFHDLLLKHNFIQHQFSVYVRHYPTLSAANAHIERLQHGVPERAHVAFYLLTDKQYSMTREFYGLQPTEKKPSERPQIELF